ncbi:MAG: hypothetical protein EON58_20330 [Alphaproteobacteria bacterium]|nr:MAG: hypothetical protein EON58_20330 [Alphaproteobacteria bacterium]
MRAVQQSGNPLAFWICCVWDQDEWAVVVDEVYKFHNRARGPKAAQRRADRHITQLVQDRARTDPVVVQAEKWGARIGRADLNRELGPGT